jgi:hypothetical protein
MTRAICAASTLGARGRTSCKRQVSGSIPLTGSQFSGRTSTLVPRAMERFAEYQASRVAKRQSALQKWRP